MRFQFSLIFVRTECRKFMYLAQFQTQIPWYLRSKLRTFGCEFMNAQISRNDYISQCFDNVLFPDLQYTSMTLTARLYYKEYLTMKHTNIYNYTLPLKQLATYFRRSAGVPAYMSGLRYSLSINLLTSYTQWPINVGGQTMIDGRGLLSGDPVA